MTNSEFIARANYTGQVVTAGIHWNPSAGLRALGLSARVSGFYTHLAPRGAVSMYPTGLPVHGPRVCAPGAYAR